MKKLIAISIAVLMVLGISVLSHADVTATTKNIGVLLGVDSDFGMQIWDTEFSQTLTNVLPGFGTTGNIHIYATSNHSLPWTVSASSAGLVGTTQAIPDTLPVTMSTFDGGAGLTGTIVTDLPLTAVAAPIYISSASEYPVAGLEVDAIFAVNTTTTTKQDLYSGTIVLTMTE